MTGLLKGSQFKVRDTFHCEYLRVTETSDSLSGHSESFIEITECLTRTRAFSVVRSGKRKRRIILSDEFLGAVEIVLLLFFLTESDRGFYYQQEDQNNLKTRGSAARKKFCSSLKELLKEPDEKVIEGPTKKL